ncbi:MAG: hypothetical protein RIS94_1858 [Pseudomonadota bacterium]|jgi:hypothetical protein
MRRLLCLFLALIALPAAAQESVRTWTDADGVRWTETTTVEVVDEDEAETGTDRLVDLPSSPAVQGIARFGPFVVVDPTHAALAAETDARSPARFAAMLRAFPGIAVLEMVDCPGTVDDTANLALGRMIRRAGLQTEVPAGGSVRSGAVELFLAGTVRHAAPDAEFAVHAWQDDDGRQPADFSAADPVNRAYIDYYRAMGLTADQASGFYALTNSVPNDRVLWLHTADIARYASLN